MQLPAFCIKIAKDDDDVNHKRLMSTLSGNLNHQSCESFGFNRRRNLQLAIPVAFLLENVNLWHYELMSGPHLSHNL